MDVGPQSLLLQCPRSHIGEAGCQESKPLIIQSTINRGQYTHNVTNSVWIPSFKWCIRLLLWKVVTAQQIWQLQQSQNQHLPCRTSTQGASLNPGENHLPGANGQVSNTNPVSMTVKPPFWNTVNAKMFMDKSACKVPLWKYFANNNFCDCCCSIAWRYCGGHRAWNKVFKVVILLITSSRFSVIPNKIW
jgi:hypothetical protein